MANGTKNGNGNGNGKANGNGNGSGPTYRSKNECFLAYREGRSIRHISEHSRFARSAIRKWRDEDEWDKRIAELDAEQVRLHEAQTFCFEIEFLNDIRAMLQRKLPEMEAQVNKPIDFQRMFNVYCDLRKLGHDDDADAVADIVQRVTVSLDPVDGGEGDGGE